MKDYRNLTLVMSSRKQFYDRLARETGGRTVAADIYIPRESGRAFSVRRGQILRVTCVEGAQTADFNAFALDDPAEHFWSGRTRTVQGSHLTVGDRLWGTEPKMRPMFTIIADTVDHRPLPHNAASHDLLYARCSARSWELQTGEKDHANCNSNLTRALAEAGFPPAPVHDAFNIFMTTGVDDDHRLFYREPDAKVGDYVELYAEIDTMVAISACPAGCNGAENKGLGCIVYDHPHGAADD